MQRIAPTEAVWNVYESPLGPLTLEASSRGLTSIAFPGRRHCRRDEMRSPATLAPAIRQLGAYFAGERRAFDLDLDLTGDPLSIRIWSELCAVPYGGTTTYGELGRRVGLEDARVVGRLVGSTPVPIVIPCHRVIGADGSLRGYGGGLHRKRALLALERRGVACSYDVPSWVHEQLELIS